MMHIYDNVNEFTKVDTYNLTDEQKLEIVINLGALKKIFNKMI